MKGSTTLTASTRPALSAAAILGNGTTTYLTEAGLTPFALSSALVSSVWMLLVRLTAMVLPARSGGGFVARRGGAQVVGMVFLWNGAGGGALLFDAPLG